MLKTLDTISLTQSVAFCDLTKYNKNLLEKYIRGQYVQTR